MKVLLPVHTVPPILFLMMCSYIGQRKRNTPVFDAVPPMNRVSKKSLIWMLRLGVRLGIALCSAGGHSKGNENSPNIFTPPRRIHRSVISVSDALLHLVDGENLAAHHDKS